MSAKTISMCQGKGSLSHNNRTFSAKNIDKSRTHDNITFTKQSLKQAYNELFGEAVERYNAKQKRNDRKVDDYFKHLFNREPSMSVLTGKNKQKSFYEDLVQIGTKDDTGVGMPDANIAKTCLIKYMEGFKDRNPNFHVFNAVLHLDEATPHLHIDYIPIGHFKNGIDTRNAMAKALEEMDYGKGVDAINRWRLSEWGVLRNICESNGIEISEPQKSRGYSFTTLEYGEYKDTIKQLETAKSQAENECNVVKEELQKVADKKTRLVNIDRIPTGKTVFGGKVIVSQEDYHNLTALAKKYVVSVNQTKQLKSENGELRSRISDLDYQVRSLKQEVEKYRKPSIHKQLAEKQREIDFNNLNRKYNRVMDFIEQRGLERELEQFEQFRRRMRSLGNMEL